MDEVDESDVRRGFVEELIGSMKYYKTENGQFTPLAFYAGGVIGNVQLMVYNLFDKIEVEHIEYRSGIFDEEIKSYLGPEQEYILLNINDILDEVHRRYLIENFFVIKRPPLFVRKFKKWLIALLP